jgi:hypothetical protein
MMPGSAVLTLFDRYAVARSIVLSNFTEPLVPDGAPAGRRERGSSIH